MASPHPTIPDERLMVTSQGSLHHTLPHPQPHTTYSLQTELFHQITNLLLGYSESVRIHSHLWKNWAQLMVIFASYIGDLLLSFLALILPPRQPHSKDMIELPRTPQPEFPFPSSCIQMNLMSVPHLFLLL